jgi:hypothetical protein
MQCRWSSDANKSTAVSWVKSLNDKLEPFARGLYVNQAKETLGLLSALMDRITLGWLRSRRSMIQTMCCI